MLVASRRRTEQLSLTKCFVFFCGNREPLHNNRHRPSKRDLKHVISKGIATGKNEKQSGWPSFAIGDLVSMIVRKKCSNRDDVALFRRTLWLQFNRHVNYRKTAKNNLGRVRRRSGASVRVQRFHDLFFSSSGSKQTLSLIRISPERTSSCSYFLPPCGVWTETQFPRMPVKRSNSSSRSRRQNLVAHRCNHRKLR